MIDLANALNDRQREAVLITEGPLMVLAGAGSGKTKMLTYRIAHLIQDLQVPMHQILAVTFTNKAAAEMHERVLKILSLSPSTRLDISTFHSFCIRILRREIHNTAFTRNFTIYDDADQLSLIKTVLKNLKVNEESTPPQSIQHKINRFKCDGMDPTILSEQLQEIYAAYQKEMIANNALDFGEIICMTYRLFRDQPAIRAKYQRWYRYIHVDEYQDTNRAQYLLLSYLASTEFQGHQNICVVGDEDQSIYKWRGADIRNILNFRKEYPGAQLVKLEQNYRSTQTILAVAEQVIQNNKQRNEKTLWTENPVGTKVVYSHLPDERAEAEMVIGEIKSLISREGYSYNQFAIFYRTNAQSRVFEDTLRKEKIPHKIFGGLKFYERKEIKDILSYFKLILNPSDTISLKRVINVPARGIGKTTLDKIMQFHYREATELNGPSGVETSPAVPPPTIMDKITAWIANPRSADHGLTAGTLKKLGGFTQLMQKLIEQQPEVLLSELYHLILDQTQYVIQLKQEGSEESLTRIQNLEEFDRLLIEFEESQLQGLTDEETEVKKKELLTLFIEQSALASDVDSSLSAEAEQMGSVKLMTFHSSKGLEFPVVFMVGMEDGLFPSLKWENVSEEDLEEERRLCYVGITRARERLYLTHVIMRRIWGNTSYQRPSRFFQEMPEEFLEAREFNPSSVSAKSEGGWIGKRISHPEYGPGRIISSEGTGYDQKITIQFSAMNQERKFLLRYLLDYF